MIRLYKKKCFLTQFYSNAMQENIALILKLEAKCLLGRSLMLFNFSTTGWSFTKHVFNRPRHYVNCGKRQLPFCFATNVDGSVIQYISDGRTANLTEDRQESHWMFTSELVVLKLPLPVNPQRTLRPNLTLFFLAGIVPQGFFQLLSIFLQCVFFLYLFYFQRVNECVRIFCNIFYYFNYQ